MKWKTYLLWKYRFRCVICNKRPRYNKLHGHHVKSKFLYPSFKEDKNNGVILCEQCHNNFHQKYGILNNLSVKDFLCLYGYKKISKVKGIKRVLPYMGDYFNIKDSYKKSRNSKSY